MQIPVIGTVLGVLLVGGIVVWANLIGISRMKNKKKREAAFYSFMLGLGFILIIMIIGGILLSKITPNEYALKGITNLA